MVHELLLDRARDTLAERRAATGALAEGRDDVAGAADAHIERDHLVISAEKESETEETEGRFTRREFSYGSFKRSFHLDERSKRDGINATYEDGVLKIKLPKKEEEVKRSITQRIEIQ